MRPARRVLPRPWPVKPSPYQARPPSAFPKYGVSRVVEQMGPPQA